MHQRLRIKLILLTLAFPFTVLLFGYVYLSVCAGRALTPSEFARFSNAIAKSAIHPREGGASKALSLARAALSSPPSNESIELGERKYVFPLPKYAVPQEKTNGRVSFLAFVSSDEMQDYFYRELPEAGWTHVDQMGAGHFLEGHGAHLTITQNFYLTSDISEFNVSISEVR
jgi:hypothetical protein